MSDPTPLEILDAAVTRLKGSEAGRDHLELLRYSAEGDSLDAQELECVTALLRQIHGGSLAGSARSLVREAVGL